MMSSFGNYSSNIDAAATKEHMMSSNNSLYHSSPCLKKVLSEQFLHQFKQKTDIDQIKQKLIDLKLKRGQLDQETSSLLVGSGNSMQFMQDLKFSNLISGSTPQVKSVGISKQKKGAQGVQLQNSPWKTCGNNQLSKSTAKSLTSKMVNDPSGLNGLSFCPMHRNCHQDYTKRIKICTCGADGKSGQPCRCGSRIWGGDDVAASRGRGEDGEGWDGGKYGWIQKQNLKDQSFLSGKLSEKHLKHDIGKKNGVLGKNTFNFKDRYESEFANSQKTILQMFMLESYFTGTTQEILPTGQSIFLNYSLKPSCCATHDNPSKKTQLLFALNPFVMNCCFNIDNKLGAAQQCANRNIKAGLTSSQQKDSTSQSVDNQKQANLDEEQKCHQNGLLNWHCQAYSYDNSKQGAKISPREYSELLILIDLCRIKLTQYQQELK